MAELGARRKKIENRIKNIENKIREKKDRE